MPDTIPGGTIGNCTPWRRDLDGRVGGTPQQVRPWESRHPAGELGHCVVILGVDLRAHRSSYSGMEGSTWCYGGGSFVYTTWLFRVDSSTRQLLHTLLWNHKGKQQCIRLSFSIITYSTKLILYGVGKVTVPWKRFKFYVRHCSFSSSKCWKCPPEAWRHVCTQCRHSEGWQEVSVWCIR